jgi:hypothetical protein
MNRTALLQESHDGEAWRTILNTEDYIVRDNFNTRRRLHEDWYHDKTLESTDTLFVTRRRNGYIIKYRITQVSR